MRRAVVLAALVAAVAAPATRAHEDPASDVLDTQSVYFPPEIKYGGHEKQALLSTVDEARKRGYPIKVALITRRYDLGEVRTLFGKPQQYARSLGRELSSLNKGPLLIAMPNGYGIYNANRLVARERAVLARIAPQQDPTAMAVAAANAVRRLAAAAGHPLSGGEVKLTSRSRSTKNQDRLVIVLAAAGAAVLLGAAWFWRRRRPSAPV